MRLARALAILGRAWPLAVLAPMALVWLSPMMRGWWSSHTMWYDPLRALGVVDAWRGGLLDARWFPRFDYGYGYPFLSFYAPLFHWLSGAWLLILGSATRAVRVNYACWLVFGTAGAYRVGEAFWRYVTRGAATALRPGLWCAIGWLASPYLLCDAYVRGDGAEFAAIQTLPWTVWAGLRVLAPRTAWNHSDSRAMLAGVAITTAGILAHNFLGMVVVGIAVMMVPFVLVLRSAESETTRRAGFGRRSAVWLGGVVWALGLTAFFWLPALLEMKFTHISKLREGYFNYANHFLEWSNLVHIRFWGFGASVPGPADEMPLHLGWVSLAALGSAVLGLVGSARGRRRDRAVLTATAALVLTSLLFVVLTTSLTAWLWSRLPLLQFAQFPWRLFGPATLGIVLLLPAGLVAARPRPHAAVVGLGLVAAAAVFFVSARDYIQVRGTLTEDAESVAARWRHDRILTVESDEYGPMWRTSNRLVWMPAGTVLAGKSLGAEAVGSNGISWSLVVDNRAQVEQALVVALNYFPGWQARRRPSGASLTLSPEPGTGFIRIGGIPPGHSEIELRLGDTPVRRAAKLFSIAAALAWLLAWISLLVRGRRERRPAPG
jgi:hypothetical protein